MIGVSLDFHLVGLARFLVMRGQVARAAVEHLAPLSRTAVTR